MSDHKTTIVKTRSFLAANVETILEYLSIRREDQKNDSDDLFGGGGDDEDIHSQVTWKKDYQLLNPLEVLLNEKESLGLFVSGNPLGDFADFAEWCRDTVLRDDVYLVLFNKVRKIFTKKNLMMFAIEISTTEGDYEAIIFPKNALKYSPLLVEKQLYWVKGKITEGQNNTSKPKKEDTAQQINTTSELANDAAEKTDDEDQASVVVDDEPREYEEKPKMIIDSLTRFTDGILPLFEGENLQFSINRKALLDSIQWTAIRSDPEHFEQYVGNQAAENQAKTEQDATASAIKTLRIPKTLGPEKLKRVKEMLHTQRIANGVEVYVEVQTATEWKRAKGTFWVDPYLLHVEGLDVEIR